MIKFFSKKTQLLYRESLAQSYKFLNNFGLNASFHKLLSCNKVKAAIGQCRGCDDWVYHKHTRCRLQCNKRFSLRTGSRSVLVRVSRVWSRANGTSRVRFGDEGERIFLSSLRSRNSLFRAKQLTSVTGNLFRPRQDKMSLRCCQLEWPFIRHIVRTKDDINAYMAEKKKLIEYPSSLTTCEVCVTVDITLTVFVNQRYIFRNLVYFISFLLSAQS